MQSSGPALARDGRAFGRHGVVVASALAKARMAGVVVMMQRVQQGGESPVRGSVVYKTGRGRSEWKDEVPA